MHTKADLEFKYDASGNRILKIEKPRDLSTGVLLGSSEWIETYYIRDASGNIMSTYKVAGGDATWQEAHIYGSSRLGVYNPDLDLGDGACAATMDANIIYALGIGDPAADAEVNNAINSVGLSNVSSTMFGEMINGINDAQTTAPSIVEFEAYINGLIDYLCAFKCYTILNDNNFQNNLYPLINQELQNSAQMPKMDITDINSINAYWTNTAVPNIEGQLVTYYGACIADDPSISSRRLGAKQYELSNHLGNVLVTITDKKIAIPDVSNSVIEYYNAEIITISDYYPGGMLISERSETFATNGYRFGFNGMEQDDEVKSEGNSYDFGARIYDSRLGRWMSVDPMASKQPSWSSYKSFFNNPNFFIDPTGETETIVTIVINQKTGEEYIVVAQANKVMTDGQTAIVTSSLSPRSLGYQANAYYDFTTTNVVIIDEQGEMHIQSSSKIDYNSDKHFDPYYFWSDDNGDTKRDGYKTIVKGGVMFYSGTGKGGESKKTTGAVDGVDISLILAAISAVKAGAEGGPVTTLLTAIGKAATAESLGRDLGDALGTESALPETKDRICSDCDRTFDENNNVIKDDGVTEKDTIKAKDH